MKETKILLCLYALLAMTFIAFGSQSVFAGGPANELFRDALISDEIIIKQEQAKKDPTIVKSRYVEINLDSLAGKDVPQGADTIILNLFDDVSFTAVKERFETRGFTDRYTWFGLIKGVGDSQVTIVVENGSVAGNITLPGGIYQIRSVGSGIYAIYEIDQSAFPEEAPPVPVNLPDSSDLASPTSPVSAFDDGSIIDVMVVYTDDTASASADINAEIQLAIDETNTSYASSLINQRLRLVHSVEVTYAETGDMYTDLSCITSQTDGCLDNIHTLRDDYGADVVSLWVENGGAYCGIAWLMTTVSNAFESSAFSVVDRSCATGYYSFGHEFGHNMGAHHDRYVAPSPGAYDYSHGYVYTPGQWRTVMAYNTECSDLGLYCTRILYWSNPDVTYGGVPTGVPTVQLDSAHNALTLDNTAFTVANFRQEVSACEYTLTDSYGYVWCLDSLGSDSRGLYYEGTVDTGSGIRNAIASYLYSNSGVTMSADEGTGIAFNYLYRWTGSGGSGAWINTGGSYGNVSVSLSPPDAGIPLSSDPGPAVAQRNVPLETISAYTLTDTYGYLWTLNAIGSDATASYYSGTVDVISETKNAFVIYLNSNAGVSHFTERGSGQIFNYNYKWTGSGGPGIWVNFNPGYGQVDVTLTGGPDPLPDVKDNGPAPNDVETQ